MKVVILEANEVPPRVFQWFAQKEPGSAIASIMDKRPLIHTFAGDVPDAFLYPSQTWASFNTGLAYDSHKVHWYNDPKDSSQFLWSQAAERGHSVVLVNTLHSSPLTDSLHENIRCLLPDCFSPDYQTFPASYEPFQRMNISLSKENGRKSSIGDTAKHVAGSWLRNPSFHNWGISRRSVPDLARLIAAACFGRPERLRAAQFPLLADIFLRNLRLHKPDLGVLFTNHVAANMHRYWYASFPEDYSETLYNEAWVTKYSSEILVAMRLLDSWVRRLMAWCEASESALVITSSMGQRANSTLTKAEVDSNAYAYRVRDLSKLARRLGIREKFEIQSAMIPQYTMAFASEHVAMEAFSQLKPSSDEYPFTVLSDLSGASLTLSILVESAPGAEQLAEFGLEALVVDDHHSGRHDPVGSLLIANDTSAAFPRNASEIDYLTYKNGLLDLLEYGAMAS